MRKTTQNLVRRIARNAKNRGETVRVAMNRLVRERNALLAAIIHLSDERIDRAAQGVGWADAGWSDVGDLGSLNAELRDVLGPLTDTDDFDSPGVHPLERCRSSDLRPVLCLEADARNVRPFIACDSTGKVRELKIGEATR